jgi:hypothetical protein
MATVQIEISDQKAAALKAKALKSGVSAEQYVRQMVDRDLEEPAVPPVATAPPRHIFRGHRREHAQGSA